MRNFILSIIFLLFSVSLYCQDFPSPQNFSIDICYNNYQLGGGQFCGAEFPPFATVHHYFFDAPNTSEITSQLTGYNLYVNSTFLGTYTSTQFSGICLESGDYYVTALYTNPDGESLPSNSIFSAQLLSQEDFKQSETKIYPIPAQKQIVKVESKNSILLIIIYNSIGQVVLKTSQTEIDFHDFEKGFYFIKLFTYNGTFVKQVIN